jgi:DNA-binding NarL/FixJ family response regulator
MSTEHRVAIVEDDASMRDAVRQLIEGTRGFRCSGAWTSVEDGLKGLAAAPSDVLLLDIQLPGLSGTEAVPLLHARWPELSIIMFTVFEDDERIFTSLCNGASGYVLKKTRPEKLLEAIVEARGGGTPMSPDIARRVLEEFRSLRPAPPPSHNLTATEVRLLGELAEGHSYQSAAGQLNVTINTIRNHIRSIYEKLHVHSKSAAVSKALRIGII